MSKKHDFDTSSCTIIGIQNLFIKKKKKKKKNTQRKHTNKSK